MKIQGKKFLGQRIFQTEFSPDFINNSLLVLCKSKVLKGSGDTNKLRRKRRNFATKFISLAYITMKLGQRNQS